MDVKLLSYTKNAEKICASAANGCYSEKPAFEIYENMSDDSAKRIIEKVTDSGHLSVIEHSNFTFSVKGVSRSLTHQLVRHRLASYSHQSMRYVNFENFEYVIPPSVSEDPAKKEVFEMAMRIIRDTYKNFLDKGIKPEDARFILPIGTKSSIVITMNARQLLHFFSLRCCNNAQWEIRELANKMLEICRKTCPVIFRNAGSACVFYGYCPEVGKSCGKKPTLKEIKNSSF